MYLRSKEERKVYHTGINPISTRAIIFMPIFLPRDFRLGLADYSKTKSHEKTRIYN